MIIMFYQYSPIVLFVMLDEVVLTLDPNLSIYRRFKEDCPFVILTYNKKVLRNGGRLAEGNKVQCQQN